MYVTPAALSYLTQVILAASISGYFLRLLRRTPRPRHTISLTAFFIALTGFLATLFLEAALLPTPRLYAVFLQIPLLCLAWLCLLHFVYLFPDLPPSLRTESRVTLGIGALYMLWEIGYAGFRFSQLRAGVVEYRIDWTDYLLLLLLLCPAGVSLRQMVRLIPPGQPFWARWVTAWRRPPAREGRALRMFVLVFLFVAGLGILNLLRTFYVLPVAPANVGIAAGVLLALFAFALTYLNQRSEITSFMVKLAGITLMSMLALLGVIGWVIAPAHIADYVPQWPAGRALRFTPDATGGYTIAAMPYAFETASGEDLHLDDGRKRGCNAAFNFAFPFYDQSYNQIYVCNDGAISLGQPIRYREFQYRYGAGTPLLLPLLMDLDPTISSGGVFVRQEADRLIVTWDRLRGFRQPEAEFTFQAVLYINGIFEFIYKDLPEHLTFQPNDDPGASLWAIGALPGSLHNPGPQYISLTDLPASGGPEGSLHDYHLDFRRQLHRLLAPLATLILVASAFIVGGFPLLFYVSLVNPLNALLRGVQRMEAGEYTVAVPVQFPDEIGFLTRAFNALTARLGDLIHNLEARVLARTADLDAANAQLRAEIFEREQAQATVIEQQRALGAYEERERLARELHDGLGQVMGYINVQAQAAQTFLNTGKTEAALNNLGELIQAAQQAHNDIRGHILGLREPEQPQRDFLSMLRYHIQQLREHCPIETSLSVPEDFPATPFTPAGEEQALRIIQEGLANIRKHARAQHVDIILRLIGRHIQIVIEDDGCGFDVNGQIANYEGDKMSRRMTNDEDITSSSQQPAASNRPHFGLRIMHERAEKAGGQLEIRSHLDKGTRLVLALPRFEAADVTDGAGTIKDLRLLLADDHPLFLDGLRNLLMARGITVIGTARDGCEALEKTRALRPNVVVMDLNMPRCDGLEATRAIHAEFPDIKIVILTVTENEAALFEAIKGGASGYLLKNLEANTFCELLIGLLHGEVLLAPGMAARVLEEFARIAATPALPTTEDEGQLSSQQWDILRMVAEGMIYKEIAAELHLSEKTIKYHMGRIIELLQVENRAQAITYYQQTRGKDH